MKIGKSQHYPPPPPLDPAAPHRLYLIYPSQLDEKGRVHKSRKAMFYGLALPLVAALTPPDFSISIVDELVDEVDFSTCADLVGLSVTTVNAPRAFQIADLFRRRGVTVVMGGMHPTVAPDECLGHADAVVRGEAEEAWPALLRDFRQGNLRKVYQSPNWTPLDSIPRPRRDLVRRDAYEVVFDPVQTTRGCPHACSFCAVSKFFGRTYRFRPVSQVVDEIKAMGTSQVFFVDDNIAGNPRYARDLFQALIPLKLTWISQASLRIARHPDLVDLAARSGCMALLLGVESVNPRTLAAVHKTTHQVEDCGEAFRLLRQAGILAIASMILGLDDDDPSVFEATARFLENQRVPLVQLYYPVPYPGTELHRQWQDEGRIMERDWSRYIKDVVFMPKRMSRDDLRQGLWRTYRRLYSLPSIIRRIGWPPHRGFTVAVLGNLLHREAVYRGIQPLLG